MLHVLPEPKAIETGMILSIMDLKKTFMYFFHRSLFAQIREFATIVHTVMPEGKNNWGGQ